MRLHRWGLGAALLGLVSLVACETSGPVEDQGGNGPGQLDCEPLAEAAGWIPGEPVEPDAESTPERISAVGEETWELAFDLLDVTPSKDSPNIAHSPTSMFAALGMAYGRWQDDACGDSIAEVMRFPERETALHESLGAGLQALRSRALPKDEETDADAVVLNIEQSRWAVEETSVPEVTSIERFYGATPHALLDPEEKGVAVVNCVIEQQSNGLLKKFLPDDALEGADFLDVNVTYLKAPWRQGFEESPLDFTSEGGSPQEVDGLYVESLSAPYYQGEDFQAVHVPLRGEHLNLMFLMPNEGAAPSLDEFARNLSSEALRAARDTAEAEEFQLHLPKLAIPSQTINYYDPLGFDCGAPTLFALYHGAAVFMDEDGIEAAGATVAVSGDDGSTTPDLVVSIDRPFLFFVYDTETRFLLFSGRVTEL